MARPFPQALVRLFYVGNQLKIKDIDSNRITEGLLASRWLLGTQKM